MRDESLQTDMSNQPVPSSNQTILLVDDDPLVLNVTKSLLHMIGYNVITANCPTEALEIADQVQDEIHLLFTDAMMPGMTGPTLAEKLRCKRPGIKLLIASGYPDQQFQESEHNFEFLAKPYTLDSLRQKTRMALIGD
jgi:two-component system, cell cycle sensor histidine kinase and response regulator CckA